MSDLNIQTTIRSNFDQSRNRNTGFKILRLLIELATEVLYVDVVLHQNAERILGACAAIEVSVPCNCRNVRKLNHHRTVVNCGPSGGAG